MPYTNLPVGDVWDINCKLATRQVVCDCNSIQSSNGRVGSLQFILWQVMCDPCVNITKMHTIPNSVCTGSHGSLPL